MRVLWNVNGAPELIPVAEALADLKRTVNAPALERGTAEPILDRDAWESHLRDRMAAHMREHFASPGHQKQVERYREWLRDQGNG